MKRLLMIAAAVAVLGLATVAIGGAITSAREGDGPIGTFLSKVADKLGVSEEEFETAIAEARTELIDEAVAEGRLTEEQAERARESGFPLGARFRGAGEHKGYVIEAAAQVLGTSQEELKSELKDGNSLAEIVEAQDIAVDDFKAQLLIQLQPLLDSDVTDGTLTQEQADKIFGCAEEKIDSILSGERRPHRHSGGFGGLGQSMSESAESSEVTA